MSVEVFVSIAENINEVRSRITAAALRAGRKDLEAIKLLAVTKTVEIGPMEEALAAGISCFGENRVQELVRKAPYFTQEIEWHLIGHLQTNKVKQAVNQAALIHSLDSVKLAQVISESAKAQELRVPVLVQVNVSGEESKFGLEPQEVLDFLQEIAHYPGISVKGLMTMAPRVADPEEARPVFRGLAELSKQIRQRDLPEVSMQWLSMGMSNDFEIAVEEGANLVRVGSGIFGPRR